MKFGWTPIPGYIYNPIITGVLSFLCSKFSVFIGGGPPSLLWITNGISMTRLIRTENMSDFIMSALLTIGGIILAQINDQSVLFAFKLSIANCMEILIGSLIFRKICTIDKYWKIDSSRFVYGFIISGIISSIPAASLGSYFITKEFEGTNYTENWKDWFIGDSFGNCISLYMVCIFVSEYKSHQNILKLTFKMVLDYIKQVHTTEYVFYVLSLIFTVAYIYLSFVEDLHIFVSMLMILTSTVAISASSFIHGRSTSCFFLVFITAITIGSERLNVGLIVPIIECSGLENHLILPQLYLTYLTIISSLFVLFSYNYTHDMKERSSEKNAFFSHVSHEFRTPLSIIIGFSENILHDENEILSTKTREDLILIHDASLSLKYMVDDILFVFSLNRNMDISITRVQTYEFISLIDKMAHQIVSDKKHEVEFIYTHIIPPVIYIDPIRVKQLITNLVSNASKYTEEGGKVTIVFGVDNGLLKCCVKDNGRGISESDQSEIFKMFYRCRKNDDQIGVGLGLSVCKNILDSLGGEIVVISKIGVGSCFSMRFPYLEEDGGESKIEPKEERPSVEMGLNILIVEDSKPNALLLKRILSEMGNETVIVRTGEDAIESISSSPRYDVIMLDIGLPGKLNGIDVLKWVRSLDKQTKKHDTPIVIISAHVLSKDMDSCRRNGCNGFTKKPFIRKDIENIISSIYS